MLIYRDLPPAIVAHRDGLRTQGSPTTPGTWLNIRHNDSVTMLTADRGSMEQDHWQLFWQNAQYHCQTSL